MEKLDGTGMMKRFFLVFSLIIFLFGVGVLMLLNSSGFSEKIISGLLDRNLKDISVADLKITKQVFHPAGFLTLSDISLQVKSKEDTFLISFDSIHIKLHHLYSRKNARIFIDLKGLNVDSGILKCTDAKINIISSRDGALEGGNFTVEKIKYLDYEVTNIAGDIAAEESTLMIRRMTGNFYGGQIATEVLLENDRQLNYSITVSLKDVDIKKLEEANKAIFSNAKGMVDGKIEITGSKKGDYDVEGRIYSFSDTEVKASLIKPLLDYIPQSRQKKDLDLLLKQQGNIPLESAEIILLSVTDESIKTRVELKSKKFNLDIGVGFDFNIEGGVQNFLNLQKQYFLKKRWGNEKK